MTANPMVERVARALFDISFQRGRDKKWEQYRRLYEHDARIAIAAMREPTERMIMAACRKDQALFSDDGPGGAGSAWKIMIDEALKK